MNYATPLQREFDAHRVVEPSHALDALTDNVTYDVDIAAVTTDLIASTEESSWFFRDLGQYESHYEWISRDPLSEVFRTAINKHAKLLSQGVPQCSARSFERTVRLSGRCYRKACDTQKADHVAHTHCRRPGSCDIFFRRRWYSSGKLVSRPLECGAFNVMETLIAKQIAFVASNAPEGDIHGVVSFQILRVIAALAGMIIKMLVGWNPWKLVETLGAAFAFILLIPLFLGLAFESDPLVIQETN